MTTSKLAVDVYMRLKGLGDDLGCHFLKREGALIHYPCACVHFFTEFFLACTRAKRNRRRSRIVAAPNCELKLIVAVASIQSYTVITLRRRAMLKLQYTHVIDKAVTFFLHMGL